MPTDLKDRIKAQAKLEGIAVTRLLEKIGISRGTFDCWPRHRQPGVRHQARFEDYLQRRQKAVSPVEITDDDSNLPKYRFRDAMLSFNEVLFIAAAIRQTPCVFLTEEQKRDLIFKILPFERPEEGEPPPSA